MSLFRKRCEYCKQKIDEGKEIFKDVKIPGFIGTSRRAFCCDEHTNNYKKELEEYTKKSGSRKSCCG